MANLEIKTFEDWWMMQSKIPYRDEKEIAYSAYTQALNMAIDEAINKISDLKETYYGCNFVIRDAKRDTIDEACATLKSLKV